MSSRCKLGSPLRNHFSDSSYLCEILTSSKSVFEMKRTENCLFFSIMSVASGRDKNVFLRKVHLFVSFDAWSMNGYMAPPFSILIDIIDMIDVWVWFFPNFFSTSFLTSTYFSASSTRTTRTISCKK